VTRMWVCGCKGVRPMANCARNERGALEWWMNLLASPSLNPRMSSLSDAGAMGPLLLDDRQTAATLSCMKPRCGARSAKVSRLAPVAYSLARA
jgi:hypothetical protein